MGRKLGAGLVVTAGLLGAGACNGTARPMLFHRTNPEPAACPPGAGMTVTEGPMLGEMPVMTPGTAVMPGTMPPGTVTIPGPGMTVPPATPAPPIAAPPVGPPPRTAPTTNPTQLPGKPTT
jgi:hypothetical protein